MASIRERINSIKRTFIEGSVHSIDDTITFPPIDVNRVLQSHEDALILTLGVGGFDMRRILVDLSSSTDLLQMSTYRQISHLPSALENLRRLLSGFNRVTTTFLGDVVFLLQVDPITMNLAVRQYYQVELESGYPINEKTPPEPSNALQKLTKAGLLTALAPRPLFQLVPPQFRMDLHCAYH
ncbi:uncharacterized protein LOC117915221 [Vitis riparia]|uniref:uncharacterized protein LOC117915221 n=1 Tax=Vitis riparia TaxID=96939 RepID=UPI00155B1E79|nr:uncharacterized protein LOC117915221 [Vitis riparia]